MPLLNLIKSNLQTFSITFALGLAIGFAAGWRTDSWKCSADQSAAIEAAVKEQAERAKKANERSEQLEEQLATIDKNAKSTARRLDHELQKDAYKCPLLHDGVQLLRDAVSITAPGKPDDRVPGTPAD